jgi:glycerate 2-kinase
VTASDDRQASPSIRARRDLEEIYWAAVQAADPGRLVRCALDGTLAGAESVPGLISDAASVFVVAAGKASVAMALALGDRLGSKLAGGVVAGLAAADLARLGNYPVEIFKSSHPIPSKASEAAARAAIATAGRAGERDLVIIAISGGASAMMAMAPQGVELADKIAVTEAIMRAGATIRDLNVVRKHLSAIKGGHLARAAGRARVLALILSDVEGNDPATVGSGPAAPDASTFADAIAVLKRRGLWGRAPESVRDHLERGASGEISETPKSTDPAFARVTNVIVGDNRTALAGAERAALKLSYEVDHWRGLYGEADDIGRSLAAHLSALARAKRLCILAGGEPVVTVRGRGRGGRAQQAALAMAMELDRLGAERRIAALFAGTDGIDGPTDAAGAFVFADTVERARAAGLKSEVSLKRNDAYNFFKTLGDLFVTGPTGTNVNDLFAGLIGDA